MRILIVDLWSGPGHRYYTGSLVRALANHSEVTLGFLHNSDLSIQNLPHNVFQIPVPAPISLTPNQWPRILLQPLTFLRTLNAIEAFRPDIIHIAFAYPWFSGWMSQLVKRYQIVSTLHDVTPHVGEDTLRNRLGIQSIVRYSSFIFVHGQSSYDAAIQRYRRRDDFINIPHGSFNGLVKEAPARRPIPHQFLLFGRMLPYKGIDTALRAVKSLKSQAPVKLILAGAGSLHAYRTLINELRDHVTVISRMIEWAEVEQLFAECAAALVPYRHGSGSGVIATAAAFSCPTIASNIIGLRDMICHNENGLLVPPDDPSRLADAMLFAISAPDVLQRLGERARIVAETQWNWNQIAETILTTYERAVTRQNNSLGQAE